MKQLYQVKTSKCRTYYVLANGYDNAKIKIEEMIIDKNTDTIIRLDGTLDLDYKPETVDEIKHLVNAILN